MTGIPEGWGDRMKFRALALLLVIGLVLSLAACAEQNEISLYARSALVIDGETGEEIYALNADARRER